MSNMDRMQKRSGELLVSAMSRPADDWASEAAAMLHAALLMMVSIGVPIEELRVVVQKQVDVTMDRCKDILHDIDTKKDTPLN